MSILHANREVFRKSFGKVEEAISLPNLIEVQSKSFNDFAQLDFLPEERKNIGLEKVLTNVFPIGDGGRLSLEYSGYELGNWQCICGALKGISKRYSWTSANGKDSGVSRLTSDDIKAGKSYIRCSACHSRVTVQEPISPEECKSRSKTYALPLKINLQLLNWDICEKTGKKTVKSIKEQGVFVCSIPVMANLYNNAQGQKLLGSRGTFIINGVERVVVSQIHRAPGVLFSTSKKSGTSHYARIIPARGSWVDFEFDTNNILYVKVDKKKKLLITTFLQALGVPKDQLISSFYDTEKIVIENGKVYEIVSESLVGKRLEIDEAVDYSKYGIESGVRISQESLAKLKKAKVAQLTISSSSLIQKYIATPVENNATGEVLLNAGAIIDQSTVGRLLSEPGVIELNIISSSCASQPVIALTLAQDETANREGAIKDLYNRIRPGDAPSSKVMEKYIDSMFFDHKMYDLSESGRLRVNRKLGLDLPLSTTTLTLEDILRTIKYLVSLSEKGEGEIDDIDNLANRCVRLVEGLLQGQMYIGLARVEKIAKEKLRASDVTSSVMPCDFINVRPISAVLGSFFGTGQLSQFMDQTNPLSEMTHKRRISALGPGGLTRDRASLDVRDVHPSHYGRICPVETPDGHNIGLISSLSTYSRVNHLGFIETAYKPVKDGIVGRDSDVVYIDAYEERNKYVAQAITPIDKNNKITVKKMLARKNGDIFEVETNKIDFIEVSQKQLVSVATAMIPFLEHDDASRALMGSNMQRQAVPLIAPASPLVGTGVEKEIGLSAGSVVSANHAGTVEYVSAKKIVIKVDQADDQPLENWSSTVIEEYEMQKFGKSSHNTCINQSPLVKQGEKIERGQILSNGPGIINGELSLGNNVRIAFMPWRGYNFEDAIVISKRMVSDDVFTSVHLEEFSAEARDTKSGAEEITKDIPSASERELSVLDDDGIIKIGTRVAPGDILVGKVTLKGDVQVSPEEKLLRAIFGDKSREVRDTSARVSPGIHGTVVDVKVFSRSGIRKDKRYKEVVVKETAVIEKDFALRLKLIEYSFIEKINEHLKTATISVPSSVNKDEFTSLCEFASKQKDKALVKMTATLAELFNDKFKVITALKNDTIAKLRRGDDLPSGVIKMVKVTIATKRHISVGDKMAGRHGNKGVVSKIVDIEDMPYTTDGQAIDVVLNCLGVPGRMNIGQVLETIIGMACDKIGKDLREQIGKLSEEQERKQLEDLWGKEEISSLVKTYGKEVIPTLTANIAKHGMRIATPVFDGADFEKDIIPLLKKSGLAASGTYDLFDGVTGEKLTQKVTVGIMYMMKLNHMADDKLHARSVGPYSMITQQPLGGKAQFGGQRLGEMEVWALFAYGAAYTLQEMLTIKSDDVSGRTKAYESIVHGEAIPEPGMPESFNVLIKELQSLCLNIDLFKSNEEFFCE